MFEIGFGQFKQIHDIIKSNGFKNISVIHDFSKIERVVFATKSVWILILRIKSVKQLEALILL